VRGVAEPDGVTGRSRLSILTRSGGGRRGVLEDVLDSGEKSQPIVIEAIIEGTEAGGSGEIKARLPRQCPLKIEGLQVSFRRGGLALCLSFAHFVDGALPARLKDVQIALPRSASRLSVPHVLLRKRNVYALVRTRTLRTCATKMEAKRRIVTTLRTDARTGAH